MKFTVSTAISIALESFCFTELHGELSNDLAYNRLFTISRGFPSALLITVQHGNPEQLQKNDSLKA